MTTADAAVRRARDDRAAEGRVYNVGGQDWDEIVAQPTRPARDGEQIVVNMGPQHPSTHGVLRLILTLDGETVTELRASIGYLHTGIEKNMEYRTWTQGVTFFTRADYLMPFFNEAAYCLATERLLGIEDRIPERAQHHPGADDGAQPDRLAPAAASGRSAWSSARPRSSCRACGCARTSSTCSS